MVSATDRTDGKDGSRDVVYCICRVKKKNGQKYLYIVDIFKCFLCVNIAQKSCV